MLFKKVSIIGVGLIGGSIGMACRKKRIAKQVVGIGRRLSSINKAKRLGAIDKGTLDLKKGVADSNLIIIATPVDIVIEKMKECVRFVPRHTRDSSQRDSERKRGTKNHTVIIDVASIKGRIVKEADKVIKNKKGLFFVGTHPIAGSEESGVSIARPDLFNKSICIITPSKSTEDLALKKVKRFWQALGAKIELMSALEHDLVVAQISHLPHLIAYNLCASIPLKNVRLAGNGFKDLTRIAKSNPWMWSEIFIQNKANILKTQKIFEKNIKLLQSDMAKSDKAKLLKRLISAKHRRDSIG